MRHFYDFLDQRIFTRIVAYATHRLHIVALLLLWALLLLGGAYTSFELIGGNYTNGLSSIVACILLLQQVKHHRETHKKLDDLHAKIDAMAPSPATVEHDGQPHRKESHHDPSTRAVVG